MSLVLVDTTDGVATLTLDNPGERNSLTAPMVAEIIAAMDEIESNEQIGAVVVTGRAAGVLRRREPREPRGVDRREPRRDLRGVPAHRTQPASDTRRRQRCCGRGRGMNLALGCDVRLAARRARFDTRFLQIGIHPGGGHTWMLRRIAGPQTTFAAVVFGDVIDGTEAERLGLVHRCVDDDQLLGAAQEMAARAASAPRELVIEVKRTIGAMADVREHPAAVKRELDPQVWSTRQPWFAEKIAALQAKISSKQG
jgi:enoyl-CoA hydratase